MSKPIEMKKDHYYWVTPEDGGTLVCAKWLGDKWDEVRPPKAPPQQEQEKKVISGSKYNYTMKNGENMVGYGFYTYEEMLHYMKLMGLE